MKSRFENFKFRCSGIGNLMTNLGGITQKQLELLDELAQEKKTGINKNGRKISWTDNKENTLADLIVKRDKPDELPAGAISYLDEVYDDVVWGRKDILHNKYLEKGNIMEEDALQLVSDADGMFYAKNKVRLENDYIAGTPDHKGEIIIDTKCSWSMSTFRRSDLTSLYTWQIKGYLWLARLEKGVLAYCLVNNTLNQLMNAKKQMYYQMGMPEDENEKYIEALMQIERNMVFDKKAFQKDYPTYDFENPHDISIPAKFRIKTFEVALDEEDKKNMISRCVLGKKYLMNKEREDFGNS